MKKIFIVAFLMLSTLLGFSQAKYISFTDSIKPNLIGYISNYKINSIPNSNDYILAGFYDDSMYKMKYYYAQLDFEGGVLFDTILNYTPLASMPMPAQIKNSVATENDYTIFSLVQNANFKSQPFIANFDIYGNQNWNKYYEIDTAEFNPLGGLKTIDGGFVSYGNFQDWSNNRSLAYVLRTDNMGIIQWSNLYTSNDASLPQFNNQLFKVSETKDNAFLMASLIKTNNFSPDENLVNLTKLDALGNKVWSKALHFDTPLSNQISSYPEIKEITVVDSVTAFISMKIQDAFTGYYRFVLMKINPITGDISWTKSYAFPATNVSIEKVILNKENQLVAYYNHDVLGGITMKIDLNGTILSSVSNQELPMGNGNTTYYDIDNTADGGLIITGNRYANSGVMMFKTDKNFKTSCPEAYISPSPNNNPLSFTTYNVNDTIIPANFIENTLTLNHDSVSSLHDKYCYCINEIYGNVAYSAVGIPADSVMIYLYQITPSGKHVVIDSVETDLSAYYQFSFLEEGQYYVKAEPSKTKYPGYLPSYFNMPISASQWDSAFVINVVCGNNPLSYNIGLIPKLPQTGGWVCSGYVYQYYGYANKTATSKAAGEPIPDIDISIDQSPGGTVSSATTDASGFFQFSGLNNNTTFVVKVDLPGFPNDSMYTFTVNPGDPALDSLNFYVSADSVFIIPDAFVGVNVLAINDFSINIAPNPTKSSFVLDVTSTKNTGLNVSLINTLGEVVLKSKTNINVGVNKINFELQNQPSGIYFMSINFDNNHFVKKIIKQ